jgi:excisionase family DNA binding protein
VAQNRDDAGDQDPGDLDDFPRLQVSGRSAMGSRRRASTGREGAQSDGGPVAYDVPEVLRRLGVTRPTIYRFLRSGELRSFRLGSRRLVSAEALAEFIRSRESAEAG